MAELSVSKKSIKDLLSNKKADFLIPDYQRPYAWDAEKECLTLWEDVLAFAFPDMTIHNFDSKTAEYYLGPIVTFTNDKKQSEIIDGQQRLTTIMLLLRAFYSRFEKMKDPQMQKLRESIAQCIWTIDELEQPDFSQLKIDSEVASDNDKNEFLQILREGTADKMKSRYAVNYRFFQELIDQFIQVYHSYFPYLPSRILNNCFLLPIEADQQDTALRIFSTLNNRGKALSDADIFKAEFYKYYSKEGRKDEFIERWRKLDELCEKNFNPNSGTPMDELFTRYMYYERAKQGNKKTTTEALRTFYSANNYALLKCDETLSNMELLADFWNDVSIQSEDSFSPRVLERLFVLNYAPNGMWAYILSAYFLHNKDFNNKLDEEKLYTFLSRITAFIWAYAITNPGVNALRTPLYAEMVNLVNGKEVDFADFRFEKQQTQKQFQIYSFANGRPITRSMLAWWTMQQEGQEIPDLTTVFEIEHIYARKRNEKENTLTEKSNVEKLGNKALLEKRINISASDYRFEDKVKYYRGEIISKKGKKDKTINSELLSIAATKTDFTEKDILERTTSILSDFEKYMEANNLFK